MLKLHPETAVFHPRGVKGELRYNILKIIEHIRISAKNMGFILR